MTSPAQIVDRDVPPRRGHERRDAERGAGSRWSMRKAIGWTAVTTTVLIAATIASLLYARGTRRMINDMLVTPPPPEVGDPFSLRHVVLAERSRALGAGDVAGAARVNAMLSNEALRRAAAVHKAWLARRQPQTRLYAQS